MTHQSPRSSAGSTLPAAARYKWPNHCFNQKQLPISGARWVWLFHILDGRTSLEVLFHLWSGDLGQRLRGIGRMQSKEKIERHQKFQVGHYKNWREWSHTVHNLDKGEGQRKREEGRREDYSRDQRWCQNPAGIYAISVSPGQLGGPAETTIHQCIYLPLNNFHIHLWLHTVCLLLKLYLQQLLVQVFSRRTSG